MDANVPDMMQELLIKCQDEGLVDFSKPIYETRLLRAINTIAKKYQILERIYEFSSATSTEGAESIHIDKFHREFRVVLRKENRFESEEATSEAQFYDYELNKKEVHEVLQNGDYCLWESEGQLLFDYKPKEVGDTVLIYYTAHSVDESDFQDGSVPVIPERLHNEILSEAVVEIARLGLVKFTSDEPRKYKYKMLHELYAKDHREKDFLNIKNKAWIKMKPFRVI